MPLRWHTFPFLSNPSLPSPAAYWAVRPYRASVAVLSIAAVPSSRALAPQFLSRCEGSRAVPAAVQGTNANHPPDEVRWKKHMFLVILYHLQQDLQVIQILVRVKVW